MKTSMLSAEEQLIEKASAEAARRGKSLNQLMRTYLEELAGQREPSQEQKTVRTAAGIEQAVAGSARGLTPDQRT